MIPYVGCEHARELIDSLLDGELNVEEQVAVESHLRWCRTCADRVDDLRLIGASLRSGSPAHDDSSQTTQTTLAAISEGVLARVRAEREQSFEQRVREMFTDMRLFWPALGATVALAICVGVAFIVLQQAAKERPASLAAMIESLEPGSERNPLRPDRSARIDTLFGGELGANRISGGISLPRVLDNGAMLAGIPHEDALFAVAAVVSRDGRIANYELLNAPLSASAPHRNSHADHVEAVLDAVRQSRFAPAHTPVGRAVAVNMVWLIVVTTAEKADPRDVAALSAPPAPAARPHAAGAVTQQSRIRLTSTIA